VAWSISITRFIVCAGLAMVFAACGGAAQSSVRLDQASGLASEGLDLSLRRHDGEVIELRDQRGAPVLLFFFATYDDASTASTRGVARFAREALDTVVIAVALQPDARIFTAAYVETEQPPYAVAFDPENRIVQGETELGAFEAIPMFVMIDARGREVARHVGYASERQLRQWREDALHAGGLDQELGAISR
jgi:hypothetical protein